jgi:hypothetical protein
MPMAAAACFLMIWSGALAQLRSEDMINRPGGDYFEFDPPRAGPGPRVGWGACRIACNEDMNCRSWTYEAPPAPGAPALCRLKKSTPAMVDDPCCVSGVKPLGPTMPWGEDVYDADSMRSGDLMREFALQGPDDKAWFCEYACVIEIDWLSGDRCKTWSWEATPNRDHVCRLFRDDPGPSASEGDYSGKIMR